MRILTWNAHGDVGGSSLQKVTELTAVMNYWVAPGVRNDPIVIICLQEVNGQTGALSGYLNSLGWDVRWCDERVQGGGYDHVIAVHPDLSIQNAGVIDLSSFQDEEIIASSPCRAPFFADVLIPGIGLVKVATWHATLGSCKEDDIGGLSKYVAGLQNTRSGENIIIAADLNYDIGDFNESGLFPGYTGWSHHLDHIISRTVNLTDGYSSESSSDHEMVSVHF